jgi:hypothetical protein
MPPLVVDQARAVSPALPPEPPVLLSDPTQQVPALQGTVDLDERTATARLVRDEALPGQGQQAPRERSNSDDKQPVAGVSPDREAAPARARVRTAVLVLEKQQGGFAYIPAGIAPAGKAPRLGAARVKSTVLQADGDAPQPLTIVALTAGANARRGR